VSVGRRYDICISLDALAVVGMEANVFINKYHYTPPILRSTFFISEIQIGSKESLLLPMRPNAYLDP
jgi:hypothetical protein